MSIGKYWKYGLVLVCCPTMIGATMLVSAPSAPPVVWGGACTQCLTDYCDDATVGTLEETGGSAYADPDCPNHVFIADNCSSFCVTNMWGCKECYGGSVTACWFAPHGGPECEPDEDAEDADCSGAYKGDCEWWIYGRVCGCDDMGLGQGHQQGPCSIDEGQCTP